MSSRSTHRRKPPSNKAIRAALRRAGDNCSLCQRPLSHGEATISGYVSRAHKLEVAGTCCAGRLTSIWGAGLYFAPDQAEAAHVRDDREWFASNPTRSHRLRAAYPDEKFSSNLGGRPASWIVIRQVSPGVRVRAGFIPPGAMPDIEALAHATFDLIHEHAAGGKSFVTTAEIYERAMAMATGGRA